MKSLTIVIPLKQGNSPEITLRSLAGQTYRDFDIVVSQDEKGNANWARNRGFALVKTPLVLFSDDDIDWRHDAFEQLTTALGNHKEASYSYGAYEMGGRLYCDRPFDRQLLRRTNYISTMSLIRADCFPGFDEEIKRLQDWALWLDMLNKGHVGVYCGSVIFSTKRRDGITQNGEMTWSLAERIVREKYVV